MNKFLVVKVKTSKFKKTQEENKESITAIPAFVSAVFQRNMNGYCWSSYSTYYFICTFDLGILKRTAILKALEENGLTVVKDWKDEGFYS